MGYDAADAEESEYRTEQYIYEIRAEYEAKIEALRAALSELLKACEEDCGVPTEDDEDNEPVGASIDRPMSLTFGMLRRARAALASAGEK